MHDKMAMFVAVLRSVALSGIMIYALPAVIGLAGIWIALPISEMIVAVFVLWFIRARVNG